jgi:hypothetical protein
MAPLHVGEDPTAPATALFEICHAVWRAVARHGEPIALDTVPALLEKAFSPVAPAEPLLPPPAALARTLSLDL